MQEDIIMSKIRYTILLLVACVLFVGGASAQTAKSAYFLEGAFHNYQLNPAMQAERPFFSAALGNWALKTNGNFGLSNFLYPYGDNQLTTFMSSSVSADEFLGRLPQSLQLSTELGSTLFAAGFRLLGGYTTFSLTMNSTSSFNMPRGFFEFAKKGFQEDHYSFSGINVNTMNYAAFTLGYSHQIVEGLRVGVNAKYLVGLAYANLHVDKVNIQMNEDKWMVETHASAEAAFYTEVSVDAGPMDDLNEPRVPMVDAFENMETINYSNVMSALKPAARGFAFDLGIEYDMESIIKGLTVSVSLVDVGGINWKYVTKASLKDSKVEFDGIDEIDPNDFEGSIEKEVEAITADLEEMFAVPYCHGTTSGTTKLSPVMYLGAEYEMPFYRPLSFAVLYGKRFAAYGGWDEVRGYCNIAPLKWLEFSANAAYSTYGTSWGWMFNFHPKLFSFFVGSDFMITKVTPQYIPVNNMNGHITIGVNKPLGKRK